MRVLTLFCSCHAERLHSVLWYCMVFEKNMIYCSSSKIYIFVHCLVYTYILRVAVRKMPHNSKWCAFWTRYFILLQCTSDESSNSRPFRFWFDCLVISRCIIQPRKGLKRQRYKQHATVYWSPWRPYVISSAVMFITLWTLAAPRSTKRDPYKQVQRVTGCRKTETIAGISSRGIFTQQGKLLKYLLVVQAYWGSTK